MKYIYIIGEVETESDKSYYKIGYSNDISRRLAAIQNGYPKRLKVIYKKEFTRYDIIEKYIHEMLEEYRCCGEWFLLKETHVNDVIITLQQATPYQEKIIAEFQMSRINDRRLQKIRYNSFKVKSASGISASRIQ